MGPLPSAVKMYAFNNYSSNSDCPFPSTSSPTSLLLTPPRRNDKDECYSCGGQGHWAAECPKSSHPSSPGSTSSASPSSPTVIDASFPFIRCPCGKGRCVIKTSKTEANPGRKFYSCPGFGTPDGPCRFFKWCNELPEQIAAPLCPCGAGRCSINKEISGPNQGSWYFACRLKKGQGACPFLQWADSDVSNIMNRSKSVSDPCSVKHMSKKEDEGALTEFVSPAMECPKSTPNLPIMSFHDEVIKTEQFMREAGSCDPIMQLLNLISQPKIRCLQLKYPAEYLSCVDSPSVDPAIAPADVDTNAEMIDVESSTLFSQSTSNAEPDDVLLLPLSPGRNAPRSGEVQNRGMSGLHWKAYGLGLLDILESMNPGDHEAMLEVATKTFDVLQWLSVDYGHFSKDVKRYIHFASGVASIESSIDKDPPSKELNNHYNAKKAEFDAVSSCHAAAVDAKRDSDNLLQSLQEEESRLEDRLHEVRIKISLCKEETSDRQARVYDISKDMYESKRRMDAARKQMDEALELEREREVMLDAARNALRQARLKLQE